MPPQQTEQSLNILSRNKTREAGDGQSTCHSSPLGTAASPAQRERHVHSAAAKASETFPRHFISRSSYCDTCYHDSWSTLSTKKHEDERACLTSVLKGTRLSLGLPAGPSSPSTWHHLLAWPGPAIPLAGHWHTDAPVQFSRAQSKTYPWSSQFFCPNIFSDAALYMLDTHASQIPSSN